MIMEKGTQEYPCPICGSTERIVDYVAGQEKEKGVVKPDTFLCSRVSQHVVVQPGQPPVAGRTAPLIVAKYDFCAKCGQEYCYSITWDTATFRHQSGLVVPTPNMPISHN